jgi:hypothetical protein
MHQKMLFLLAAMAFTAVPQWCLSCFSGASASLSWAGLSLKSPNGCEGTGQHRPLRDDEVAL